MEIVIQPKVFYIFRVILIKMPVSSLQKLKQTNKILKFIWKAQIPDSESNLRGERQMLFFFSFVNLRFLYIFINQVTILGLKVKLKLSMETNRTVRDGRGRKKGKG